MPKLRKMETLDIGTIKDVNLTIKINYYEGIEHTQDNLIPQKIN